MNYQSVKVWQSTDNTVMSRRKSWLHSSDSSHSPSSCQRNSVALQTLFVAKQKTMTRVAHLLMVEARLSQKHIN